MLVSHHRAVRTDRAVRTSRGTKVLTGRPAVARSRRHTGRVGPDELATGFDVFLPCPTSTATGRCPPWTSRLGCSYVQRQSALLCRTPCAAVLANSVGFLMNRGTSVTAAGWPARSRQSGAGRQGLQRRGGPPGRGRRCRRQERDDDRTTYRAQPSVAQERRLADCHRLDWVQPFCTQLAARKVPRCQRSPQSPFATRKPPRPVRRHRNTAT